MKVIVNNIEFPARFVLKPELLDSLLMMEDAFGHEKTLELSFTSPYGNGLMLYILTVSKEVQKEIIEYWEEEEQFELLIELDKHRSILAEIQAKEDVKIDIEEQTY